MESRPFCPVWAGPVLFHLAWGHGPTVPPFFSAFSPARGIFKVRGPDTKKIPRRFPQFLPGTVKCFAPVPSIIPPIIVSSLVAERVTIPIWSILYSRRVGNWDPPWSGRRLCHGSFRDSKAANQENGQAHGYQKCSCLYHRLPPIVIFFYLGREHHFEAVCLDTERERLLAPHPLIIEKACQDPGPCTDSGPGARRRGPQQE